MEEWTISIEEGEAEGDWRHTATKSSRRIKLSECRPHCKSSYLWAQVSNWVRERHGEDHGRGSHSLPSLMSLSLPVVSDTSAFLGEDVSLNFPAHRNKLLECLAAHAGDVILVKGGEQLLRNHDTDLIFRQQSPFLYLALRSPRYSVFAFLGFFLLS